MGGLLIFWEVLKFLTNIIRFSEKHYANNQPLLLQLQFQYSPILQTPRPVHTVTMSHIGGSCWLVGGYRWSLLVIFSDYWQFFVIFDEFKCFLVLWQFGTADDLAPGQFGIRQFGTRTIRHQDNLAPGQFGTRPIWHHNVKIDDSIIEKRRDPSCWQKKGGRPKL